MHYRRFPPALAISIRGCDVLAPLPQSHPRNWNTIYPSQRTGMMQGVITSPSEHPDATISNLDELLEQLKETSKLRNVICHGSWRTPNSEGASIPFFVNRQQEKFETAIDVAFLFQLQKRVSELACAVVETVTHMGWQFPGSSGPGKVIWESRK